MFLDTQKVTFLSSAVVSLVASITVFIVQDYRVSQLEDELVMAHIEREDLKASIQAQYVEVVSVQDDLLHEQDVIKGKVDIIDNTIDADKKRKSRVDNVVAAINVTLPKSRRPENCEELPTPGEILRVAGAVVDMSERYAVPQALI